MVVVVVVPYPTSMTLPYSDYDLTVILYKLFDYTVYEYTTITPY